MKQKIKLEFNQPRVEIILYDTQDFLTLSLDNDPNQGVWDMKKSSGLEWIGRE